MNVILLSGGSGKRLWPLSNEERSKQFLKLIQNEDGCYESMVQRVCRQIKEVDTTNNIMITTGQNQLSSLYNQLGETVAVCVEPARRDTFPAIALSCAYMVLEKGYSKEDCVIVCPVDPYTENSYYVTLNRLEEIIKADKASIALMGVKPTYPSEKYGYIIPKGQSGTYKKVEAFNEKPTVEKAQSFIEQGGLWNCGVFAFKLGYMLEHLEKYINIDTYQTIYEQYDKLPRISFDYEVVEREASCMVVEFDGIWKDLGTWNTLTEEMAHPIIGQGIVGTKCSNVHIINELEIPLLAMGLKDIIICATSDGIIVSDKGESSYIKPFVDKIDKPPMYKEKSWGTMTILHREQDEEGVETLTIKNKIEVGKSFSYHSHTCRKEVWTILSGEGEVTCNERCFPVGAGDTVAIEVGDSHSIKAMTPLTLIEIQVEYPSQSMNLILKSKEAVK